MVVKYEQSVAVLSARGDQDSANKCHLLKKLPETLLQRQRMQNTQRVWRVRSSGQESVIVCVGHFAGFDAPWHALATSDAPEISAHGGQLEAIYLDSVMLCLAAELALLYIHAGAAQLSGCYI